MPQILLTMTLAIAGVFAVSSASKLREPAAFERSLADFGVIPRGAHHPLARTVIGVELAVVALVLMPATSVLGFVLAAGLLLAFALVILVALRRGQRPTCRCFGVRATPMRTAHAGRNVVLAVVALTGAWVASTTAIAVTVAQAGLSAFVAAVVVGIVVGFDDILQVVSPRAPVRRPAPIAQTTATRKVL